MHAHQHGAAAVDLAADQRDVHGIGDAVDIDLHVELAAMAALELRLERTLDDPVVAPAIGDEIGDGADLEAVELGELHQVGAPRHGAVVVHDLADHAGGVEAGEPCDVDRRLGVAGADENAAVAGHQGKDMAGRDDVRRSVRRIDGDRDGAGAVGRRDPGRHPLARFDRDGEGGLVAGGVLPCHQRQAKLLDPLAGQRQADQAAAEAGHEVDRVGRRHLRGDDQVAFVLAPLVIHQDDHPAVARVVDDLLDRRHHLVEAHAESFCSRRAR